MVADEDEHEAARVFYVAATRATHRLVIGVGGPSAFKLSLMKYWPVANQATVLYAIGLIEGKNCSILCPNQYPSA